VAHLHPARIKSAAAVGEENREGGAALLCHVERRWKESGRDNPPQRLAEWVWACTALKWKVSRVSMVVEDGGV
jgi:hypothetical protein